MAFELFLMGHGGYKPGNDVFTVPENFTLYFYTEHAKGLPEKDIGAILRDKKRPVRTFNSGDSVQNYSWLFGEARNWNFYVIGGDNQHDTRNRNCKSPTPEKNTHLNLADRGKKWDVRYVNFFRKLRDEKPADEYKSTYTLKELFSKDTIENWWSKDKKPPYFVHSVLCSSLL